MEQRHIEISNLFKQLKADFPKELGTFLKLSQSLEQGGAIDQKIKDLILVALAVSTRCEKCIATHIRNAVNNGASKREILEAAILTVVFGGGTSLMDMHIVYEELYNHFE
jgi:AhpD family alkylhydroperoxidase